jgi:heptose I phosphotransferase
MWLSGRFHAQLQQAGLAAFDAVMQSAGGRCLRVLADRENWYFQPLPTGADGPGLYLKKHRVRTWSTRVRAKLSASPGVTAARIEAGHAGSLSALGIDVMPLVAYGERLRRDGMLESFLLTEELAGYEELQDFLRRRFPPRSPAVAGRDPELRRILGDVAEIVRRLHAAGYNHRDLYCCHFLIKEPAPGEFDIRLIDLQRVQRRRWFRRRWIVKDLAQLAYSAPRDRVGCKDQIAIMHHYLGVRKLRGRDKRLIAAVTRKVRVMQRRLGVQS